MALPDQTYEFAGTINDHSKEVGDVAAENAHVERLRLREGSKRTLAGDRGAAVNRHAKLGADEDRRSRPADAAELMRTRDLWKCEVAKTAALKTVRSAPTSTKSSTGSHEPSAARTSLSKIGRMMPSSHCVQRPRMSIDSLHLFARDIAQEKAIVFGMCCSGAGRHGWRCVSDEKLLAGDADELAAMLAINLGNAGLKPIRVFAKALPLRLDLGDFNRVGHLDHHQRRNDAIMSSLFDVL
jgi:hypothetical protein